MQLKFSLFCFRKLSVFDTWSRLAVHVAMDNTVVIEEISTCVITTTVMMQYDDVISVCVCV